MSELPPPPTTEAAHPATHGMRHNDIHLPDGTISVLCIPQCGRLWVSGTDQALDAHTTSHSDFSYRVHFKYRAVLCDVCVVDGLIVPYLQCGTAQCSNVVHTHVCTVHQQSTQHACRYSHCVCVCECACVRVCMWYSTYLDKAISPSCDQLPFLQVQCLNYSLSKGKGSYSNTQH